MTQTQHTAEAPISGFDDTGLPAWQEIDRLVKKEGIRLSQTARDELAGMLVWARYGKTIAKAAGAK
jgi:hypothetical protein